MVVSVKTQTYKHKNTYTQEPQPSSLLTTTCHILLSYLDPYIAVGSQGRVTQTCGGTVTDVPL